MQFIFCVYSFLPLFFALSKKYLVETKDAQPLRKEAHKDYDGNANYYEDSEYGSEYDDDQIEFGSEYDVDEDLSEYDDDDDDEDEDDETTANDEQFDHLPGGGD